MVSNNTICPACGSQEISREIHESFDQLTLGAQFSFKEVSYRCSTCDETGDFLAENDEYYLVARKKAEVDFVKKVLFYIGAGFGRSFPQAERSLELPFGILRKWNSGDFSSSEVALLRIIMTYPWILEVAENKFEKKFSKEELVRQAKLITGNK